jgi:hypothetical protein
VKLFNALKDKNTLRPSVFRVREPGSSSTSGCNELWLATYSALSIDAAGTADTLTAALALNGKRGPPLCLRNQQPFRCDRSGTLVSRCVRARTASSSPGNASFQCGFRREVISAAASKCFFEKVFSSSSNPIPLVVNVDKNPGYPAVVEALKAGGTLPPPHSSALAQVSQQCH